MGLQYREVNKVLNKFVLNIGKFFIKISGHPDTYLVESYKKNPNRSDLILFNNVFRKIKGRTLLDRFRLYVLWQLTIYAKELEGDFAEVGVYKGGSAYLVLSLLKGKKTFYLFDTFEGLPKGIDGLDRIKEGTFNDVTFKSVCEFLAPFPNKKIVKGFFPDTAGIIKRKSFSYVYLDVDIYPSTRDSLKFFWPRMVAGGIIVLDDYGYTGSLPGVSKAVLEFAKEKGIYPIYLPTRQALFIKK